MPLGNHSACCSYVKWNLSRAVAMVLLLIAKNNMVAVQYLLQAPPPSPLLGCSLKAKESSPCQLWRNKWAHRQRCPQVLEGANNLLCGFQIWSSPCLLTLEACSSRRSLDRLHYPLVSCRLHRWIHCLSMQIRSQWGCHWLQYSMQVLYWVLHCWNPFHSSFEFLNILSFIIVWISN